MKGRILQFIFSKNPKQSEGKMKNLKILLVDDEVEFVTTLAERLRLREFQTEISADGEEALNLFDASVFDVIVLDVFMPGMSGFDVLKELKKRSSNIPVILLTGHGATEEGVEGMSLGAFDYLMKPIDIEELTEKINAAVKGNK